VKALIWDMDGVIADSRLAHYRAWKELMEAQGVAITYERFAATFGMNNWPILKGWLGEDTPPEVLRDLADRKEALFRQYAATEAKILPGVREWLEWARRQGYRQAVASSGPMANIVALVMAMEIADYFDALISGAFWPRSKPDPAIFLQAAAALGAEPRHCVVLEDGVVGVEAAQRAGMACIAVTTTHPAEKLADADIVVGSLAELNAATIERLLAP